MAVEAIGGRSDQFQLTGAYLPPPSTAVLAPDLVDAIAITASQTYIGGERLHHAICGDFNRTEWAELFDCWVRHNGLRELSDP